MRIGSRIMAPVVMAAFIIGIGLSMAFNLWRTESVKVPAKYSRGEFAGQYDPADIRGSYTFGDIEAAFGIPLDELAKAFGLSEMEDPASFQVKELEEMYGESPDGGEIGTDSVRLFVAGYAGLPYVPVESTRMPSPAVSVLREKLSPADYEAVRAISVQLNQVKPDEAAVPAEKPEDAAEHTEEIAIKGKTTFDDLIRWGLSQEEIEDILQRPMGARGGTVREFLEGEGLEFSEYKTKLQELLDSRQSE